MLTKPSPAAEAARQAVLDAIKPYASQIKAHEILAIVAYTVGQLIALQDQRVLTPEMALELVSKNIQMGNTDAIADLQKSVGGTS